jgi:hypothetical protein
MQFVRLDILLFLVSCAAALALLHVIVTYRDRGSLSAVTAAIALGKGIGLIRRLIPTRAVLAA